MHKDRDRQTGAAADRPGTRHEGCCAESGNDEGGCAGRNCTGGRGPSARSLGRWHDEVAVVDQQRTEERAGVGSGQGSGEECADGCDEGDQVMSINVTVRTSAGQRPGS